MKKVLFGMAVVMALTGCSSMVDNRPMPTLNTESVTCDSEDLCSYLWSIAPEKISMASRMKVENANDTFIMTYPPIDTRQLGARVAKIKLPNGGDKIEANFECHRHAAIKDCERFTINAKNFFNEVMLINKNSYTK